MVCTSRQLKNNGLPQEGRLQSAWRSALRMMHLNKVEPTPDKDPFYGYTSTQAQNAVHQPGTLLRVRPVYLADFPGYGADHLNGWQLAFVSRGQTQDEATVTVATVIVPQEAGARDKLLFIAPKTDAASPTCRTSYMLRRGSGSITGAASEQIFMIDFLRRGWICVQVDYEGQYDGFGAGPTAGHSMLDAIRATVVCPDVKLAAKDQLKVVMWGYSGGAISVGWATLMLHTYAPELVPLIRGISHGGVPCDLKAVAHQVNDGLAAGLIIGTMRGLANVHADFDDWLQSNSNERGKQMLQLAKDGCFWSIMTKNTFDDILNLKPGGVRKADLGCFTTPGDPLAYEVPARVMRQNDMLAAVAILSAQTSKPPARAAIPMFVYQSTNDEVVPLHIVDELVASWVRSGYVTVEYEKIRLLPHVGAIFAMHSQNVQWIADRFDGKPFVGNQGQTAGKDVAIDDQNAKTVLGEQNAQKLAQYYDKNYKDSPWW